LRLSRQPTAGRRMRPEPPLTTRQPPLNEIGVIPPTPACRDPSPAARPSRPAIAAPPSARLPGRTGRNRTELTTDDAPHSADPAWLTAVSAMGPASRRSNRSALRQHARPKRPFQYQ